MPIGKCRMCLHEKTLVRSHLMPAALYDYCRKGEHRPIKVGGGFVMPTDRQTQDYLLCEDCEDVLNTGASAGFWTSLRHGSGHFLYMTFSRRSHPFLMKMAWSYISQPRIPISRRRSLRILPLVCSGKLRCIHGGGIRTILASIWGRILKKYGSGFEAKTHFPNMCTSSW